MFERLKLFKSNYRNILKLVKYISVSIFMLLIVWLIDVKNPSLKTSLPDILFLSTETSENFLSSLSGVFLSISTFTFTTILTVIGIYNSSYSPRIIQNFIDKPIVLNVLGSYIGGFFYTILSLLMLKHTSAEEDVIAGTIGILFAIVSMLFFIRFVQEVLRDVKSSNIIEDIYNKGTNLINQELKEREKSELSSPDLFNSKYKISALDTGFLYSVDYDAILEIMEEFKAEILITHQIGDYLTEGEYVAELRLFEKDIKEDKLRALENAIGKQFLCNTERNDLDDYQNEISNLSEIAVRALSPGINDPNTAINSLRKISDMVARISSSESLYRVVRKNDRVTIFYEVESFENVLFESYGQIINSGKETPSLMATLLQSLQIVYAKAGESNKKIVRIFFRDVYDIAMAESDYSFNHSKFKQIKEKFINTEDFIEDEASSEE